jgi:DNA (cytosine-5)-methyltransferase 1
MTNRSEIAGGASLSVAGLFAGIGGIELGLNAAGHHTSVLCEIDDGARRVLRTYFPGLPRRFDVRRLRSVPRVDVVTAGFPCQDLSQAGRTEGITGKNSGLIQHVFALLSRTKRLPTWLVLENVSFMLQLDRGQGMRYLIDELERLKLTWAYRIVDTNAFGLPQRRQRVILLASPTEDPKDVLFADDAEPIVTAFSRDRWCGFYWTEGLRGLGWAVEAVPTLKGGSTIGIPSPPAVWIPETDFIGTPSIEDAEQLQGFAAGWTEPAAHGPKTAMRDQVRRRRLYNHRWKLVGNAVSVPVAKWIGERLATPGEYDPARTGALLERGVAWPRAAWGHNGQVYPVSVSMWPVARPAPHLSNFLGRLTPLSERATAGFLSRISIAKLQFVPGFKDGVARHLENMRRGSASVTAVA